MTRRQIIAREIAKLPVMQIVRKQVRNARRRLAQRPLTGAYYWVPIPGKGGKKVEWTVLEFYDQDYGGAAAHVKVWPEVVFYLAARWGRPEAVIKRKLGMSEYGLPRGRVAQMTNGQYGIAHGGDAPIPNAIRVIKRLFNLRNVPAVPYRDEHEVMMSGHPQEIEQALGIKLRLKVPPPPDFDDGKPF